MMMNNLDFIIKQIEKRIWTQDCQGKQDLDMPVLSINTRYYPDFTAKPSFMLCDDSIDSDIDYTILLEPKGYIVGESEDECKLKVKEWYISNLKNALEKLLEDKGENNERFDYKTSTGVF